jgi:hypothetical protein
MAARGVECDALAVAEPGREALGGRELLTDTVRVVAPDPRSRLELRAWIEPRRVEHAVLRLAGIGGGAEIDIEPALRIDRERVHRMVAGQGQPRNHNLRGAGRRDHARRQGITHDAIVHLRVKRPAVERDACAARTAGRHAVAEANLDVGPSVAIGVLERDQETAGRRRVITVVAPAPGVDVDHPVRGNDEVSSMADIVREDGRAKPGRQRDPAVVARASADLRCGRVGLGLRRR